MNEDPEEDGPEELIAWIDVDPNRHQVSYIPKCRRDERDPLLTLRYGYWFKTEFVMVNFFVN